jgi:alkanesulfonate monooxygenase SsuD/methylene tetrahydromethanopterin reductase-like flavin-dependent oxidoreductase (luciferase family)
LNHAVCIPTDFDAATIGELAEAAEGAGWDGVFVWDTIFLTDAWVALTAIAMRTMRVKIGPMLTPVARRRPWKLAAETATLDRLSGGRLILPVGLGVAEDERWDQLGMAAEMDRLERARLLDEGLDVLTRLWTGEPVDYDGERHHVHGAQMKCVPLQRPRPPIWVVGRWPDPPKTMLRRMLRWDGAIVSPKTDVRSLRDLVGGRPFDVLVEGKTPGVDLAALEDAGVTWWLEAINESGDDLLDLSGMRRRVDQGPIRR